jgi:hypothetical protein
MAVLMSAVWPDLSPPTSKMTIDCSRFVEVDAVPRAVVDAQLRSPLSHLFRIAEVAGHNTLDANENTRTCSHVAKPVEPAHKRVGFSNFEHTQTVANWLPGVNVPLGQRAQFLEHLSSSGFDEPGERAWAIHDPHWRFLRPDPVNERLPQDRIPPRGLERRCRPLIAGHTYRRVATSSPPVTPCHRS